MGILPGFQPGTDCVSLKTCIDLGVGFSWTSTFNGTSGGIVTTASYLPIDPGSGLGGVTVTNMVETTDYEPFTVTTVNDAPIGAAVPEPSSIAMLPAALCFLWVVVRRKKWAITL